MRDIWKMMEALNKEHIKPFVKLAIGIYVVLMAIFFAIEKNVKLGILEQSRVWIWMPYIAGACLIILHMRRVKRLHHEGSMTRVLLLPVNRAVYPIAEILFTFGTVCLCLLAGYFAIFSVMCIHFQNIGWFRNGIVYMISDFGILRTILPLTLTGLGNLIFTLFTFTMCINVCLLFYNTSNIFMQNFFFFFFSIIILLLFAVPIGYHDTNRQYVLNAMMLLMNVYAVYQITKSFRHKKVGG